MMVENSVVEQQSNDEKLRELILYISRHSEGDERYGATKLNKLLFFSDFLAYLHFGKSITGHEYQALPKGPAPRYLIPIRDELEATGEIAIRQVDFYGYGQHKIFALREPDLRKFSAEEIDLVHRVIESCWHKTEREISFDAHRFAGWKLAEQGETIPYEVALVGRREPTEDEIARGKELKDLALEYLA